MNQFGNLYSQYYDLLYSDKDYQREVEYIDDLIKNNFIDTKTVLDMGCGTGKHAELLYNKGYSVHGIDLSEDMLKIARTRRKGKEDKLNFSHSNIKALHLDKKFDVIISLFHVMSYQNSNQDLVQTFEVVKNHLVDGGIFIFDFWYGPAVLTDLPTIRVKRLENEVIKVTRIAEPALHVAHNRVDVHYDLFIEDKKNNTIVGKKEFHPMRYFFDTELELICEQIGFKIENKYKWMSTKLPDFQSWNVVWVIRK